MYHHGQTEVDSLREGQYSYCTVLTKKETNKSVTSLQNHKTVQIT